MVLEGACQLSCFQRYSLGQAHMRQQHQARLAQHGTEILCCMQAYMLQAALTRQ